MNEKIDLYLAEGCGRCSKGGTPNCTVHRWQAILVAMRELALECNLTEELKWSVPCYTVNGKNVLLIHAFMEYCGIMFMKGSLLTDEQNRLHRQTENVTAGRQLRFTTLADFFLQRDVTKAFILEAISLEKAGKKVEKRTEADPVADELLLAFDQHPTFKDAFYALTPGRQRAYLLHFSQPKQPITRTSRIEKCMPMILRGEGLHDAYQKGK